MRKDFSPTGKSTSLPDQRVEERVDLCDANFRCSRIPVTMKLYPGVPHAFYMHLSHPDSSEVFQTMVD